jgi:hypothetical protein
MPFERVKTNDEYEWDILKMATADKGKFAIGFLFTDDVKLAEAFERGLDENWYTLIDVTMQMAIAPGLPMRVYRLTDIGKLRYNELKCQFTEPANETPA